MIDGLDAPMTGDGCRAELFTEAHREALKATCAEEVEIWKIYSTPFDPEHFDASIDKLANGPLNRTFVLFEGGELAGMSSFIGIDEDRQCLEIGNRRVKDMMLRRAFDHGFRRVEFRVDSRNGRSQAAMAKLGAVREGVLRADRITWNGHVRDTVLFSILREEWP